MTPFAAFIIALIAGLSVRGTRRAVIAVIPPWLVVLLVQTWSLAPGRGHNPASTIREPSYWIVQLIALGFLVGIAAGVAQLRFLSRKPVGFDDLAASAGRQWTWRTTVAGGLATVVAGGASLASVSTDVLSLEFVPPGAPHGMPLTGAVGLAACLITVAALVIACLRASRTQASQRRSPAAALDRASEQGAGTYVGTM